MNSNSNPIKEVLEEAGYRNPSEEHQAIIREIISGLKDASEIGYTNISVKCHFCEKTSKRKIKVISQKCEKIPNGRNNIDKFRTLVSMILKKENRHGGSINQ